MTLATADQIKEYIEQASEFVKQPWQVMFRYPNSILAIAEFLAWKDGLTLYETHKRKFDSHQNAS